MNQLAFTMTPEILTVLITQGVILAGGIGKIIWDILATRKAKDARDAEAAERLEDRKQNRLDWAALAAMTANQLAVIEDNISTKGDERAKTLLKEVKAAKGVVIQGIKVNKEQIRVSNGHNEKIVAVVGEIEKIKAVPQPVVGVNDDMHPVSVESHSAPES